MEGRAPTTVKTLIRATVPRSLRNWLRSPSKSSEWLWDYARFALGERKILQYSPEWSIVCHPRVFKVAYQSQISDAEQRQEFAGFISHCCPDMVLFDVGAHFGMFSLAAAHFGGRAIAVDPSATAIRMIKIQSQLNQCSHRIEALLAAVTESSGVIQLLGSGVFSNGYFRVSGGRSARELTSVPATTIDEMVQRYGAPTHLKVDVEGHEAAVLRGARSALVRFSPLVFIELHNELAESEGVDPKAAVNELAALGYHTFNLDGEPIGRDEILHRPIIRVTARRADL